jgi:hypothetical protein
VLPEYKPMQFITDDGVDEDDRPVNRTVYCWSFCFVRSTDYLEDFSGFDSSFVVGLVIVL